MNPRAQRTRSSVVTLTKEDHALAAPTRPAIASQRRGKSNEDGSALGHLLSLFNPCNGCNDSTHLTCPPPFALCHFAIRQPSAATCEKSSLDAPIGTQGPAARSPLPDKAAHPRRPRSYLKPFAATVPVLVRERVLNEDRCR